MAFRKIQTNDPNQNLIQNNVDAGLTALQQGPLNGGIMVQALKNTAQANALLSRLSLKSGQDNLIAHSLKTVPNFWIVTRLIPATNVSVTVWEYPSTQLKNQSATNIYLNLRCSSDCTISLWVT